MINNDLNNYRLVIVNNEGKTFSYIKTIGQMHAECINDYVKKENIDFSTVMDLLDRGDCLFYNLGNGNFTVLLPQELNTMQTYTLDNMCNYMDNVENMAVETLKGNEFELKENVGDKFSTKVIQSYYEEKGKSLN